MERVSERDHRLLPKIFNTTKLLELFLQKGLRLPFSQPFRCSRRTNFIGRITAFTFASLGTLVEPFVLGRQLHWWGRILWLGLSARFKLMQGSSSGALCECCRNEFVILSEYTLVVPLVRVL